MKNLLMTAAALLAVGFANAQDVESTAAKGFAKGDVFMAGSIGVGSTKTGDNKSTDFTIAPSAAIFLTDNIALGARIAYSSSKAENAIADTMDASSVEFGVFGRYYATPASDFSLFAELGVAYGTVEDNLADTTDKGFGIGLAPGVSYFISEHFALEAAFGILNYNSYEADGAADKTNSFNFGLDMSDIQLGLVYKF